ncbi:hypothetical protein GGE65_002649 [Skermanella aerolata]|uniref:hypothetical protein n=1 Tax=Skermanella aerolata TaxID=393310 RepID=UPI003D1B21BD
MDFVEYAQDSAFWLKRIFNAEWRNIQTSMQSANADDLSFDICQAAQAMEVADRVLRHLTANPTTRLLDLPILAMTAHIFGIMSARPLICRHASASYVDYVNITFAAISAFNRLGLGSFLSIDPLILRRFIMTFHGRATWPEPFVGDLHPDIERDLSAMLFFFEAYMRRGIWVPYKFRNPGLSHRFH